MAEISSHEEEEHQQEQPQQQQQQQQQKQARRVTNGTSKALAFWFYFSISASLLALLLSPLLRASSFSSYLLSLPDDLRAHYSLSTTIKTHLHRRPVAVSVISLGPRSSHTVLLLHGLGSSSFSFRHILRSLSSRSFRAVAVDLPGAGFSDTLEEDRAGIFGPVFRVWSDIKEKGLFWGFDQLVEKGGVLFDEMPERRSDTEGSEYGAENLGRIIGQVVDSMALAPLHLVLHDSAVEAGANWVSRRPELVLSVTLIDPVAGLPAFPSGILGVPVLGQVVLRSGALFRLLLRSCCSRSIDGLSAESYRLLLRKKGGKEGVVAAGKGLNHSFDVGEWALSERLRNVPIQVLWSNMWSDRWINESRRVAASIPLAKFAYHSGGRWPQEDAADEIAGLIEQFLSSLPKSNQQAKEDPEPELTQKIVHEGTDHHHHHDHGDHHHVYGLSHGEFHEHAADYTAMYGLGQGW